ncbi:MAG TPA: BTAD domain-containing putative transcriptional regulator [Longimicrobiales bacterium]
MIRLQTLGSLDLRAADGAVLHPVLRQSKRLALLAYLAIEKPGQFHRRDQLLGLFWPEADLRGARASLSQAVHFLRQHLGKEAIVNRGDEEIGLAADRVWCDAAAFQAHMAAGEFEEAVTLCQGDLLAGLFVDEADGFEQWLEQKRDTLRREAMRGCSALADAAEKEGRFDNVAGWLRRAIHCFPYEETLHRRLIVALDGAGDRAAALRAYDELVQTLRAEYDAEPSAETTEVINAVRARTEAQTIPLPARPVYMLTESAGATRVLPQPANRARGQRRLVLAVTLSLLIVAGVLWGAFWPRESTTSEAPVNRIAVLFFNDASPNQQLAYLAEGLTSALISHLGQVGQIQVISENGVRPFRGDSIPLDSIAKLLDVGTIVGGSINESNGKLRVTVEMVKGSTGVLAKSETFERPAGELFALLDDVTAKVGSFLRSSVGQEIKLQRYRSETGSVDAWRAVQQAEKVFEDAKAAGERSDARVSDRLFAQADSLLRYAAAVDRRWAEPLVVRARMEENRAWLALAGGDGGPAKHLEAALVAANEALARSEQSAAAFEARGRVRFVQWLLNAPPAAEASALLGRSEADLVQALTLDPNRARAESTLSLLYESEGRFDQAMRAAERALAADAYLEDAEQIVVLLFHAAFELGDDEKAGHWCDEARRRMPGKWVSAYCDLVLLGWRADAKPDARKALYILETFGTAEPGSLREAMKPQLEVLAAVTVARSGDVARAEQLVQHARGAAPADVELLRHAAAYHISRNELQQARLLLEEYLAKRPLARPRVENGRMFRPLRPALVADAAAQLNSTGRRSPR